jgi:fatty acid desaturase
MTDTAPHASAPLSSAAPSPAPLSSTHGETAGEAFRVQARAALAPDVVRRLSGVSAAQGVFTLARTFGLLAATAGLGAWVWAQPFAGWHLLILALCVPLIAAGQHGLFVIAHEAAHYRLFPRRGWNDFWGSVCGAMGGVSMHAYRVVHRLHHNHLYEAIDPDLPLIAGYPRGRAYLAKKLLTDLAGFTAHKNYAYFFGAPGRFSGEDGGSRILDDTSPRLRQAALRDRWRVAAFHGIAPIAAFASGWGGAYLVLWALPLVTVLQAILRFRAVCEHGAVPDRTSPLRAARTNLVPRWLAWAVFPHHVNYHVEHHLYPSIPHDRLPEAHRLLREAGALANAEVCTLDATVRKIFAERAPRAAS